MKKILTKKGFTLIELIVVIAILAILAAILIPSLTNYLSKAEAAKDAANARTLYTAATLEAATWDSSTAITEAGVATEALAQTPGIDAAATLTVTLGTNNEVTGISFDPDGTGAKAAIALP